LWSAYRARLRRRAIDAAANDVSAMSAYVPKSLRSDDVVVQTHPPPASDEGGGSDDVDA
jgi:hypothetical protein